MANGTLTWKKLEEICPKETNAIDAFLDKCDIELYTYFHGEARDMDWYEVINIRDCHLKIGEFAEAEEEKKLADQAQELWEMLKAAYEQATKDGPLCRRIVAVAFENEGAFNEKPYFLTESVPATLSAAELVAQGENTSCEFKSTLRINLHTGADDGRMEHACLKTIAAFLNTHGGYLLIGVSDKGEPLGIENNKFPNEDRMHLHLISLIRDRIGAEHPVDSQFETLGDKCVLLVHCWPSKTPAFLKDGNTERFFVRMGPASRELRPSEICRYIRQRFHETD